MEIELSSGALADLHASIGAKRGVVISPDINGRRALFDEMAARLSFTHGWHVIVVDPFRGHHFVTGETEERLAVMSKLVDDDVVGDLVDAANRLEVEPVALIGFSVGGMYAFKSSASHRFDRLVSFYGMVKVPESWRGPGQREPLQLLRHAADPAHVMAVVGTEDEYSSPADIDELEAAQVPVVRYDGAKHGFVHDPSLPAHRARDATDAWARAISHIAV